ncbi:MAG: hypothetical protein U1E76_15315 [Planctomycetota bacterium]
MRPAVLLVSLLLVVSARAGEQDYYISLPAMKGVWRLDAATLTLTPFVSGPQFPFYGEWSLDGNLYVPDTTLQTVWAADAGGNITRFSYGGLLTSPATVAVMDSGDVLVSDLFANRIVRITPAGQQSLFADNTAGLFDGPGGMAFSPEGDLYVANHYGNTIVRVDGAGQVFPFTDGQGLLKGPAGLQVDGSGNLFVVNYWDQHVIRIPVDTGLAEAFADDLLLDGGNDLKLSRRGRLLVTIEHLSALLEVDALGHPTMLHQDYAVGPWEGVAVPEDYPHCPGRMRAYGQGTPGKGGYVPALRGIYSPCLGAHVALDIKDVVGGATGFLMWGLSAGSSSAFGGTILVGFTPPFGFLQIKHPGPPGVAGAGDLRLPLTVSSDPQLAGISAYLQDLALDPDAPQGVSMSNGLEVLHGD